MNYKIFSSYLFAILLTIIILFLPYLTFDKEEINSPESLRVMTYSSFLQKWSAGPELARRFKEETGIDIHWINAGNAGLIIERLKFKRRSDRPDMIIGFDQFSIHEARKLFDWVDLRNFSKSVKDNRLPEGAQFFDFLAYDWGPMTFVHNNKAGASPQRLQDLISPRYQERLILQDPRMSSPGLQFLLWVLADMGEDAGFDFLKRLQPSIKIMSHSWSSSYSIFKMQKQSLVFSYFTSPLFHELEEDDDSYQAVRFENPHPIQVEYAGIPKFCENCDKAKTFALFLLRPDIQRILMEKNYMFPVEGQALQGSRFKIPEGIRYYKPIESLSLIKKKRDLINRWKKVFY